MYQTYSAVEVQSLLTWRPLTATIPTHVEEPSQERLEYRNGLVIYLHIMDAA